MTEDNGGTLRAIAWSEIFPWVSLFRTFRLAIAFRAMLLSSVAVVLMLSGWWVIASIFTSGLDTTPGTAREQDRAWAAAYRVCPWTAITKTIPDHPALFGFSGGGGPSETASSRVDTTTEWDVPLLGAWQWLTRPLLLVFTQGVSLTGLACLLLFGLWALAVWSFFGAAIARIAAVQLACEERLGWGAVIQHATSKWPAYFAAPVFPAIGILVAAIPAALFGLIMRVDALVIVAAILWPLFLVAALLMALLLLGLIFGWPLMWATIATEGTDSFDALSRSYAYVFQRPLHYLFYVIVAAAFGWLGWILVSQFAAGVVGLAYWSAAWGAGNAQIGAIAHGGSLGIIGGAGAAIIRFCAGCVKVFAFGYVFSYFWTASTAIYYLLRRNVDATEMDEVFLDDETQSFGLPPLKTDGPGAPAVAEDLAEATPAESDPGPEEK